MRNIQDKKGMSIGDMYPAVLIVIMVGLVLGVGLYVLATFHDQIATSQTGSQNEINTSAGTTTMTDSSLTEFNVSSITAINASNGGSQTNFTFTGAGVITWGTDLIAMAQSGQSTLNITYTYIYDATDSPEEATTTTITGIATFADWIAIIVVVIAAAIVLGIVLTSFGRRRNTI